MGYQQFAGTTKFLVFFAREAYQYREFLKDETLQCTKPTHGFYPPLSLTHTHVHTGIHTRILVHIHIHRKRGPIHTYLCIRPHV